MFPISISQEQGKFLKKLVEKQKPKVLIECGFGFGISSLWLLSAKHSPEKYYIIDTFRESGVPNDFIYKQVIKNKNVEFIENLTTQQFLAQFEAQGKKADLIFMDADERFDGLLTDFYFAFRVLEKDGTIILRNVWNPSIRKVLLFYIKNLPVILSQLTQFQSVLLKFLPSSFSSYLLKRWLSEVDLCVIKLYKQDMRPWNHFNNF